VNIQTARGEHRWLQFESLIGFPNLRHLFSLRSESGGGNISLSGGRDQAKAIESRATFLSAMGANPSCLVVGGQVHGSDIQIVREAEKGKGATSPETVLFETDGLLTTVPHLPLMTAVGDCGAVLLFVEKPKPGIAVLHAGWRGLVGKILPKAVHLLCEETGAQPKSVLAGIGPCIAFDSFQVQEDVARFAPKTCLEEYKDRFLLNLPGWAQLQLEEAGLLPSNIEGILLDTFVNEELCFSHRRQGPPAGRMGLFAMLSEPG
jgi:hypothetical protein|tara:strand:- start:10699 stop:11484 length:786 start_codon:yes stop_codon:yes gene_type:complete